MNEIVLVDDNTDHLELMGLALRASDNPCPVVTFSSGEDCVAAIERGSVKPRLVLLDFNMPGLDGPAAVQRLRGLDAMRTVPIVMMSTSDQALDVQRARAAGADSFVIKPRNDQTWLGLMSTLMHYWTEIDLSGRA
jgi:CheY-like chemotaxis protein